MVIGQFAQDSSGAFIDRTSTSRIWAGRILSGAVVLFLIVDAIPKVLGMGFAVDATVELGYPAGTVTWIGLTLLACTILYALPRTTVLGTVLLTGYLGGAVATQARVESPDILFALGFGALVWAGGYLRDERVRALLRA